MQKTLPAALETVLEQPSSWHRLPPPCAMQYPKTSRAVLEHPSFWQRLPPPCALQWGVPPDTATLEHPSSSHCRLPMALVRAHSTPPKPQLTCGAPSTAVTHPSQTSTTR